MVLEVLSGRTTIVPFGDNMMQVANLPCMVQPLPAAFNVHQKTASIPVSGWQATVMCLGTKTFRAPREIM